MKTPLPQSCRFSQPSNEWERKQRTKTASDKQQRLITVVCVCVCVVLADNCSSEINKKRTRITNCSLKCTFFFFIIRRGQISVRCMLVTWYKRRYGDKISMFMINAWSSCEQSWRSLFQDIARSREIKKMCLEIKKLRDKCS